MSWSLIAHITSGGGNTGSSGSATSPAADTTSTNLIVVYADDAGPGESISAPTAPQDSYGNTYTPIVTVNDGANASGGLFYCVGPAVGASHTWTPEGSFGDICVAAFSGSRTSSPVDQYNSAGSVATTGTFSSGAITPTQDNCLAVGAICATAGNHLFTDPSGFTPTDNVIYGATGRLGRGMAYQIQTTATTVNPTWTWTVATSEQCAAVVSFFPPATSRPVKMVGRWGGYTGSSGGFAG